MTIDQIIALIASIGACLSALAAFFTLSELKKQQSESHSPIIKLEKGHFWLSTRENENPFFNWKVERDNKTKEILGEVHSNRFPSYSLRMVNIGLASGTDLSYKWDFDIESYVSLLNNLAQKSLTNSFFEVGSMLSFKSTEFVNYGVSTNDIGELDYILPSSIEQEAQYLNLPISYLVLASMHFYLVTKDMEKHLPIELPSLKLHINYRDILGKIKTSDLNVCLSASLLSSHECSGTITIENCVK